MELSENAEKIFQRKYAQTRMNGNKETWPQAVGRVANHIAAAEENTDDRLQYTAEFTRIMLERSFLPGGRVIANAGTSIKNLMNCFVLPVYDSREGIYSALEKAAQIFAWGGGIGYNFSDLRAKGSTVKTTGGKASGPLSFMELFDLTGEVISQASRRGAQMGILNVDHPDIMRFIQYKRALNDRNSRLLKEIIENSRNIDIDIDTGMALTDVIKKSMADNQLSHFNISVGILDEFMENLDEAYYQFSNQQVLEEIAKNAWASGDPGLFFLGRTNVDNMIPYVGDLVATNPCGEVPLLPYEPCDLGSINLAQFVDGKIFDFNYLREVVHLAIRFMDNVHSLNYTPITEINEMAQQTRRLGLGVMGWADVLAEMGIPYDHEDAYILADTISKFIQREAWIESMNLAEERGPFPAFDEDKVNWTLIDHCGLERKPVRNVACTSIAPTGTISLIADANSGIEPFFAKKYVRNVTDGVGNEAKDSFEQGSELDVKTAHEIHWKDHIRMQATWQNNVDNAVSKTINMSEDSTVEDVIDAYKLAWELGCKGITVYRDKSREFQILNVKDED